MENEKLERKERCAFGKLVRTSLRNGAEKNPKKVYHKKSTGVENLNQETPSDAPRGKRDFTGEV